MTDSGSVVQRTHAPHVLLAVTGSIAAFKAIQLTSDLKHKGYDVKVMLTEHAQQFVQPVTFESLCGNRVRTDMFPHMEYAQSIDTAGEPHIGISHIEDAKWADVIAVVPATANTIAKLACGIADNYVSSTLLAARCPVLIAPAMNTYMYAHPATQRNLQTIAHDGAVIIEPESGLLACNDIGRGRLASLDDIERAIDIVLHNNADCDIAAHHTSNAPHVQHAQHITSAYHARNVHIGSTSSTNSAGSTGSVGTTSDVDNTSNSSNTITKVLDPLRHALAGKHVLITAGPTQEPLDPVRYITNHSTGTMGYALARQAQAMGATVTLISGPVALSAPEHVNIVRVVTAQDMFAAVQEHFADCDIAIMAAAVGDFRPEHMADNKIKKQGKATMQLNLVANPDILAWAGAHRRTEQPQILCGFAMETQDLLAHASQKLLKKHADMIVANSLREEGAGFGTGTNVVTLLSAQPSPHAQQTGLGVYAVSLQRMEKSDVAQAILQELITQHNLA